MRPEHPLVGALREALAHAQGKRSLRTTVLPAAPAPMSAREIRRLRRDVNASQAVFAHALNVSTKLVQAWEAGRRRPEGAALRLLRLGGERPEVVFSAPDLDPPPATRRRRVRT